MIFEPEKERPKGATHSCRRRIAITVDQGSIISDEWCSSVLADVKFKGSP